MDVLSTEDRRDAEREREVEEESEREQEPAARQPHISHSSDKVYFLHYIKPFRNRILSLWHDPDKKNGRWVRKKGKKKVGEKKDERAKA